MTEELQLLVGWVDRWVLGLTAGFSLVGWLLGGGTVGVGVAAGGLVAIFNFKWLQFFTFRVVLAAGGPWAKVLTHLGVAVRYLALSVILLALIKSQWVNLFGLLVGLSVVSLAVAVVGLFHGLQSSRSINPAG